MKSGRVKVKGNALHASAGIVALLQHETVAFAQREMPSWSRGGTARVIYCCTSTILHPET